MHRLLNVQEITVTLYMFFSIIHKHIITTIFLKILGPCHTRYQTILLYMCSL